MTARPLQQLADLRRSLAASLPAETFEPQLWPEHLDTETRALLAQPDQRADLELVLAGRPQLAQVKTSLERYETDRWSASLWQRRQRRQRREALRSRREWEQRALEMTGPDMRALREQLAKPPIGLANPVMGVMFLGAALGAVGGAVALIQGAALIGIVALLVAVCVSVLLIQDRVDYNANRWFAELRAQLDARSREWDAKLGGDAKLAGAVAWLQQETQTIPGVGGVLARQMARSLARDFPQLEHVVPRQPTGTDLVEGLQPVLTRSRQVVRAHRGGLLGLLAGTCTFLLSMRVTRSLLPPR